MAADGVTSAVNELIKEAVLAAVREELAAHKEEVDELRHMLTAVQGELAELKRTMADRASGGTGLRGKISKGRRRTQVVRWNVDVEIMQSEGDQKAAWEAIKSASQETDLELRNLNSLLDTMLAHVSTMTHLTSINLYSTSGFSAEGIKHLFRLPRLEKLDLRASDISDSALEGIGSLTSLTHLYLYTTKVTDAGLPCLTDLPSLTHLALNECKGVKDAGMVHVGRLTGLETLCLNLTAVTDDGLQQLTADSMDVRKNALREGSYTQADRQVECQGVVMEREVREDLTDCLGETEERRGGKGCEG
ncbi:unnamed protein product [Closterium sp. Yama58-4]|nr:unnamed protein product [Closterium sp. Yama58-4]